MLTNFFLDFQGCDTLFLTCNTKPSKSDSSHGHLDLCLVTATLNKQYLSLIQASVTIRKMLLNKYYDATDHSEVYHITMGMFSMESYTLNVCSDVRGVLHPCHKLEYFKRARWDDEWIVTAYKIVQTEFNHAYAFMELNEPDIQPPLLCSSSDSFNLFFVTHKVNSS
jgi:hypothetical protein